MKTTAFVLILFLTGFELWAQLPPASLKLQGHTVGWIHGGVARQAAL